jgi:N-acetylglutamate synthase-like GNAT family acetyltransferase
VVARTRRALPFPAIAARRQLSIGRSPRSLAADALWPRDARERLGHTQPVSIVRIRVACAGDLPALRDVFRRSSLSNEGDRDLLLARPEVLELADEGIVDGRTQVAVGADDAIVGFITTRVLDAGVLEIEDLFVDPDCMRTGVATRLVEDLLATASGHGVRRIEVTANPHAAAFYRRVGFVKGHDSETRLGGAPRMYLTVHGGEANGSDTGSDRR